MFLQQTAAGGLCALFLLLLQRIFRNLLSPRWQYGIWGVLVLRLLIPAGVWGRSTVLDVWPWLEAARAGTELTLDSAYSSPWTLSLPRGPIPLLPAEAPRSLTDWLFLLYLAGALGLALWYLGCALLLSLRVSRGVPVEGPRRAAIDAVAQRYQLPRPRRVVECRWERSPFLTGFLAPALVLPMGWEPDEKVILHELLHLKHRDLWAGWLTAALRCLHWCDPLLWLAFDKADNDREALCDQRVLERLEGEDRRDYGRVLLSMADSRAVRVPGATTMANGARIQAIARFKRFPRGMALVSGCMGAALVMALAVGGPAPGGETNPVTVSPQGCSVPGILATAERSRAATVAGALDSYGKTMLHRLHQPALALLCRGMTVPEEDLPQVLEQYREALRLSEEHPEQLLRWWRSGPVFRGLVSDGGGGFLCQVFWFRDQEMQVGDVYPREDGAPWPVEYLCHTVHLLPDGPYWTVEKLAETEGLLEDDFYDMDLPLCGPVTWSGEADGLRLEISAAQILETGDGFLGRERLRTLHDPSSFPFTIGETEEDDALSPAPMPRLPGFSALRSIFWGTLLLFLDFDLNFRFGFSFTLPLLPNCIGFWLVARGTRSLAADRPSLGLLGPFWLALGLWSLQQFFPGLSPSYPRRVLPSGRSGPDVRRLSAVHRSGRSGGGPAPRRAPPPAAALRPDRGRPADHPLLLPGPAAPGPLADAGGGRRRLLRPCLHPAPAVAALPGHGSRSGGIHITRLHRPPAARPRHTKNSEPGDNSL